MSNKMTVQIYGSKYNIVTTEDSGYVHTLAAEIDNTVTELMQHSGMSVNQALILTALSSQDAYRKSEQNADNLRRQVTEYAEELAEARKNAVQAVQEEEGADNLRRQITDYADENGKLRRELAELRKQTARQQDPERLPGV